MAELTGLTSLGLEGTPVSDLTPLAGLTNLSELWVDKGVETTPLENLPNLRIHRA